MGNSIPPKPSPGPEQLGTYTEIIGTYTEIKAYYKRLLQQNHPDRGGDPQKFIEIMAQYKAALKPRVCPECEGKGHVWIKNGPVRTKQHCPNCWRL